MIPLGEWSCNICGPSPTSDSRWCDRGCGRDYNQMTWVPPDVRVMGLDQPFASLWAMGAKTIETRAEPFASTIPLPAWVLVHANAKTYPKSWEGMGGMLGDFSLHRDGRGEPWYMLQRPWPGREWGAAQYPIAMPLGAIVGAVHVTESLPIVRKTGVPERPIVMNYEANGALAHVKLWIHHGIGDHPDDRCIDDQFPYGDFTPGRYGYLGDEFHVLRTPIPHKGKQGWSDRATPELIAAANAQIWGEP